jgi:hypothetical protein
MRIEDHVRFVQRLKFTVARLPGNELSRFINKSIFRKQKGNMWSIIEVFLQELRLF